MDKVTVVKDGLSYSIERFDADGYKQVAQGGIPVNFSYKARQFVVTTVGLHPANHNHVQAFDSLESFEPFDVTEGSFDVTFSDGGETKSGTLDLANQEGGADGNQSLAKDLLGLSFQNPGDAIFSGALDVTLTPEQSEVRHPDGSPVQPTTPTPAAE